MEKRLYRSRKERMLFGVCGGLGKYFGMDPTIIRIIMVLLVFAGGVGILLYAIMALVVPLEGTEKESPKDVVIENAFEMKDTAMSFGQEVKETFGNQKPASENNEKVIGNRRNLLAIILIAVGVVLLLSTLGVLSLFHWFNWGFVGAVALIIAGIMIVAGVRRK